MNKNITVVVVEDEELVRMLAADALNDAGFDVIEAKSADDAMKILEADAVNLNVLFTDVHMPGLMSGLALAQHASQHWPWISIIIASGLARPRCKDLPASSRFFAKPYSLEQVMNHIKQVA